MVLVVSNGIICIWTTGGGDCQACSDGYVCMNDSDCSSGFCEFVDSLEETGKRCLPAPLVARLQSESGLGVMVSQTIAMGLFPLHDFNATLFRSAVAAALPKVRANETLITSAAVAGSTKEPYLSVTLVIPIAKGKNMEAAKGVAQGLAKRIILASNAISASIAHTVTVRNPIAREVAVLPPKLMVQGMLNWIQQATHIRHQVPTLFLPLPCCIRSTRAVVLLQAVSSGR